MVQLYDKVLSILTIPDRNTNQTDANSTDPYEVWKNGDGQYLLPLFLLFVIFFCCICVIFHACFWLICSCFVSITASPESEKSEKRSFPTDSSEEIMAKSEESQKMFPGNSGTSRSRKTGESPKSSTLSV